MLDSIGSLAFSRYGVSEWQIQEFVWHIFSELKTFSALQFETEKLIKSDQNSARHIFLAGPFATSNNINCTWCSTK